jgi:hypothetical protein
MVITNLKITSLQITKGIALFLCIGLLASCASTTRFGVPNMDMTGIVYDQDTMQPIEGAYVLAEYRGGGSDWVHMHSWCIKTKGMYTSKDGSYRFPVEKFDNMSPSSAYAIKSDYYTFGRVIAEPDVQRAQNKGTYSNRHIYLKKQDAAKPVFQFGFHNCERPAFNNDLVGALQFMKIVYAEYVKYGRDAIVLGYAAEDIARIEKMLAIQSINLVK